RDEIFSKVVRAGKRTYFLDVKSTRKNDYYLTITESKKRFNKDGSHYFEKHKVFLYKEDFDKFTDDLHEVIGFIKEANKKNEQKENNETKNPEDKKDAVLISDSERYTSDVKFDDLKNSNY
ncbi:MAG: DUF3276 family protein, partial [Bacteroidota bacterium]|nr:DUF3276 family protein [Bacteroidota bacterium]